MRGHISRTQIQHPLDSENSTKFCWGSSKLSRTAENYNDEITGKIIHVYTIDKVTDPTKDGELTHNHTVVASGCVFQFKHLRDQLQPFEHINIITSHQPQHKNICYTSVITVCKNFQHNLLISQHDNSLTDTETPCIMFNSQVNSIAAILWLSRMDFVANI